jgi:hypothetical protein
MLLVDRVTSAGYGYSADVIARAGVDKPGPYVIVRATNVSNKLSNSSGFLQRLAIGTEVDVIEIVPAPEEKRLRAKIGNPDGWISLLNLEDGQRWACSKVEPSTQELNQRDGTCIDAICEDGTTCSTTLRGAITSAQHRALEFKTFVYIKAREVSFSVVDTIDLLIDRYLPVEETNREIAEATRAKLTPALIPRMFGLPFKIPPRISHATIMKLQSASDAVQVLVRWIVQVTSDQKAKYKAMVLSQSRAIAERAASPSIVVSLQQGKQDASKRKHAVRANDCASREYLRIIDLKDAIVRNARSFHQSIIDASCGIAMAAPKPAYDVTVPIAGKDRAAGIFCVG